MAEIPCTTTANLTQEVGALRIRGDSSRQGKATVVREIPLTIFLNGREIVTLLCTGAHVESLAVGFLRSEGLLHRRQSITAVEVDRQTHVVRVSSSEETSSAVELQGKRTVTSGCGKGTLFYHVLDSIHSRAIRSPLTVTVAQIRRLMSKLNQRSELYRLSRGVHNCALAAGEEILIFRTDIGRHNAVDMIVGECFLNDISTSDKILVTTGRITSEILIKAAKMKLPMLISRSAATSLSLDLARDLNITVVGLVRGGGMVVYTGRENVIMQTAGSS
ncbi:MAG: formate dehydrogenase accessory sulfurtransferase FdhD [Deltaproteobacteria bacterium]|nr:formate dehydrogenase accessory sulfurtransferase FdhD [Deltaproteobacteria bacterium]MBW2070198.1 formate dehydrogenase accessory sulfurtransferase FdhD [Deltaproteobacteria bacterium]